MIDSYVRARMSLSIENTREERNQSRINEFSAIRTIQEGERPLQGIIESERETVS